MHKKYIISGAPGTGKSTLINALEQIGISCMHEISRQVIQNEQLAGSNGTPWADIERFTQLVYTATKLHFYQSASDQFCDRSLIDNIAYLHHHRKDIPSNLDHFPYEAHYHYTVFFARPWREIYVNDAQRPETFEQQVSLGKQLEKTYAERGFDLVYLPFDSVKARVAFIQAYFRRNTSLRQPNPVRVLPNQTTEVSKTAALTKNNSKGFVRHNLSNPLS